MTRVLINLHSEQTIPNYIAINEINPDKVIALATKEYSNQVKIFEDTTNIEHVLKIIDAYQIDKNFIVIQEAVNELRNSNDIVVNYTGGTKVMSVSLVLKILMSTKQAIKFVYVNTRDKKLEFLELNRNDSLITYSKNINICVFLKTYLQLKGEKIKSSTDNLSSEIIDRFELSEKLLLDNRLKFIFKNQKKFFETVKRETRPKQSYNFVNKDFELSWNKNQLTLRINEFEYKYLHSDGGRYFTGGWLEEYVFIKLIKAKLFDQVLANVKFDFTSFSTYKNQNIFKNEIDVVITKGLKTVFLECKAGYVSQDYVYKLQVIRNHFLGTFGEAVLVTKFKQKENIIEKCSDANINIISGDDIQNIDSIINQIIK